MDFRLVYRGPLHSDGTSLEKQTIRREFHRQLRVLWQQEPLRQHLPWVMEPALTGERPLVRDVSPFRVMPLVREDLYLVARLDILLLRPAAPGQLIGTGGDLDNRLKTLLDALRMPSTAEIPEADTPGPDETPFYCVLEDDALVTAVSVTTDRLLSDPGASKSMVELVIQVQVRATRNLAGNIAFM